jgi:hypothetical protein
VKKEKRKAKKTESPSPKMERKVSVNDDWFIVDFKSFVIPKFVANLLITFSSSKIGRDLRNKVRKYISMFELL